MTLSVLRSKPAGFTLIEFLVSAACLALSITLILRGYDHAVQIEKIVKTKLALDAVDESLRYKFGQSVRKYLKENDQEIFNSTIRLGDTAAMNFSKDISFDVAGAPVKVAEEVRSKIDLCKMPKIDRLDKDPMHFCMQINTLKNVNATDKTDFTHAQYAFARFVIKIKRASTFKQVSATEFTKEEGAVAEIEFSIFWTYKPSGGEIRIINAKKRQFFLVPVS